MCTVCTYLIPIVEVQKFNGSSEGYLIQEIEKYLFPFFQSNFSSAKKK